MIIKSKAFTLIELLIVVSVIGVLAAVLINVINPRRSQGAARDGVRMANIEKTAQALEAYNAAEGKFPTVAEVGGHLPTTATIKAHPILKDYIQNWPEKTATDYDYKYYMDANGNFVLSVKTERGTSSCLKYGATEGKMFHCKECGNPYVAQCDPPTNYYE